jgi:hypothetical protein
LVAGPFGIDVLQHLDAQMSEIGKNHSLRPETVPKQRLVGIGPLLHDPDDARRIVTEHFEPLFTLVEFGSAGIEWK